MAAVEEVLGRLFTAQEVADYFGIDVINLYRKIKKGELKAMKIGKCWKIREEDLREFMEQHKTN